MAKDKNEAAPPAPEAGAVTSQIAKHAGFNFGGVGHEVQLAGGLTFKVKQQVTREVIKQKDNETIFVEIQSPIYTGRELKNQRKGGDGKPEMAPARLCEVADLRTGRLGLIICNTVLEGAIREAFPAVDDSVKMSVLADDGTKTEVPKPEYVGKRLAITMHPAPDGKRYKRFEIFEMELAADAETGEVA